MYTMNIRLWVPSKKVPLHRKEYDNFILSLKMFFSSCRPRLCGNYLKLFRVELPYCRDEARLPGKPKLNPSRIATKCSHFEPGKYAQGPPAPRTADFILAFFL